MMGLPDLGMEIGCECADGDFSTFNRRIAQELWRPPTIQELWICQWNWVRDENDRNRTDE